MEREGEVMCDGRL